MWLHAPAQMFSVLQMAAPMLAAPANTYQNMVAAQPYEQAPQALRQTSLSMGGDGFVDDLNVAEAKGFQAEANALDGAVGFRPYHIWGMTITPRKVWSNP